MTSHAEIIDNMKVICQCNGIKKGTFKKLVAEGANNIEKLNSLTGSGAGSCGGKRCGPRLAEMLENLK